MSLTRGMLKAMGIEADAIEQIISAHTETTDALKAERDRYKAEAGKVGELEGELESTRKKLKDAENTDAYDKLKADYDKANGELEELRAGKAKLQSEFDQYKADQEAAGIRRGKRDAYKALLEEAGVAAKYVGKVLKVTDLEGLELGEDGKLKDSKKLAEAIKTEWPEFISTPSTKGASPATPPTTGGTDNGVSARAQGRINDYYERRFGKAEQ